MTIECLFLPPDTPGRIEDDLEVVCVSPGMQGRRMPFRDTVGSIGQPVALVLPVERVTACAVSLPTRRARWLHQALPYAVEELLAEDPERLHFALGEQLADGRHRVVAVDRNLLAGWLEQLEARGLQVAAIHVDADLLPRDGATTLWVADGRCLLGGAGDARLAFQPASWPALAPACASPVVAYGVAPDCRWLEAGRYHPETDLHGLLANGRAGSTDLAQGGFARRAADRSARHRLLLRVVGVALLLQLASTHGQAWYLEHRADRHYAASESIYRELFPRDTRIVDLRAQFDVHRAGGGNDGHFLSLLGTAADAVAANPALELLRLDYAVANGLTLELHAGSFVELEALRERLAAEGLSVQLGSASRDEGGVAARVLVGG